MELELDKWFIEEIKNELRMTEWRMGEKGIHEYTSASLINETYNKFRCTLFCSLLAHQNKQTHLENVSLDEQAKFLQQNRGEWEYLKSRVDNSKKLREARHTVPYSKKPKTFWEKIKELIE